MRWRRPSGYAAEVGFGGRVHLEDPTLARMKGPAAHLLLPCRSESVHTVRALLHRDLERWHVAEEIADSVQLAIAEAVAYDGVNGSWRQREGVNMVRWALVNAVCKIT